MNKILVAQFQIIPFQSDIEEANKLELNGFYTSAFLRRWQTVEAISRSLMIYYSACEEAEETGNKIFKVLKKGKIDISKYNLDKQIYDKLVSSVKKRIEPHFKYIKVSDVESALKNLEVEYDSKKLKYLLASEVKQKPPDAPIKTTIREQRNRIIHKNQPIDKKRYDQLMPFFEHFFDIVTQVTKSAHDAVQGR